MTIPIDQWPLKGMTAPFKGRTSILKHIQQHLPSTGPGLLPGGEDLPDEKEQTSPWQLSPDEWPPGSVEGAHVHQETPEPDEEQIDAVGFTLRQMTGTRPTPVAFSALYETVKNVPLISYVDPLIEAVLADRKMRPNRLYQLAHWLATMSPDREPAKLGIVLLGLFEGEEEVALCKTLGRHEELTFFAAVAVESLSAQPEQDLWEMAQAVHGWGRIHTVEQLAGTQNHEIQAWILREGFRNKIMPEYLAYIAATTGKLAKELKQTDIDDDLLHAAGEILDALLSGGPAEEISDYAESAAAVIAYTRHVAQQPPTLPNFVAAHSLHGFFASPRATRAVQKEHGWSAEILQNTVEDLSRILERSDWTHLVRQKLRTRNEQEFTLACRAAFALGIDTTDAHRERLKADPLRWESWNAILDQSNLEKQVTVLDLAREYLPLPLPVASSEKEATQSPLTSGIGEDIRLSRALETILQKSSRSSGFPPEELWDFLWVALQSPLASCRRQALDIITSWERSNWPAEASLALRRAHRDETNTDLKEDLARLLDIS